MASKMLVDADGSFTDWIDITNELAAGAKQLKVGELLKPDSLTLFDAMVAVQVMDPRLDMGMLTAEDQAEISLWDFNKRLTLTDTLWIIDRMFSCEMTLHNSAALLQTIYTCNYFTVDENQIPRATIGNRREGACENPARDLVLYPVLIAVGACCARVWREYQNDNLYPDEDVHSGVVVPRFFAEYSLRDVHRLLESAREYLQEVIAGKGDAETQKRAAGVLAELIEIRDGWLRVLEDLSAETLAEDPGALRRGMEQLRSLAALHKRYVEGSGREAAESALATPVRGVFDSKCMRKYPTLSPVRPRELLTHDEAHAAFARMLDDTAQVEELLGIESAERMIHFFLRFSRRSPTPVPFVRSLVMSAFATDGRVQLAQQSAAGLARRAVSELGGSYVWATLETARGAAGIDARERADAFCTEAAGLLVCWLKSLCQNPPRQRRIALKSIGGWDALQADGEQLDMAVFALANPQQPPAAAADPETNVFALSSWAYHMKLLAMETALLAGVRLEVYLDYEFAQVFCYAAQVFDAHQAHMERVARVAALQSSSRQNPQMQPYPQMLPWTARTVGSDECLAQIERWHVLAGAQKDLATALWLVSHVSRRLGVFRAPWEQRTTRLALEISRQQQQNSREMLGAQQARFALRFRAFAQLGSPAPPSFAGWLATSAQLDSHALGDLLLHAGNVAGEAKAVLERSRRAVASGPTHALDEWDACFRPLYFVVLANAVALTKLRKRAPALAQMPQPLRVLGDQALRYRSQAVDAALARQTGTEGGNHSNGSSGSNGSSQQPQPRTKSERRRRKGTGRQDQINASSAAAVAQRWLDDAARLTKSEVKIAWSCTPSKHPDWPVFSFQ